MSPASREPRGALVILLPRNIFDELQRSLSVLPGSSFRDRYTHELRVCSSSVDPLPALPSFVPGLGIVATDRATSGWLKWQSLRP
jgi:hypothetical protein